MGSADQRSMKYIQIVLARGWHVELRHHNDRAGPKGTPEDPAYPEVYSVYFRRIETTTQEMQIAKGRHGRLVDALEQADGERCDFEGKIS